MTNDATDGGLPQPRRAAPAVFSAVLGLAGLAFALATGGLLGWVFAAFLLLAVRFWRTPRPGDARLLARAIVGVVAGIVLLFMGMVAIWETAEVIVLRQLDDEGEPFETRLWVIDLEGVPSFAAADPDVHARVGLLQRHPRVELIRGDRTECRQATLVVPDAALAAEAERLYQEKYGFRVALASQLVALLLGAPNQNGQVIVRLEPCEPAA